jgi:hypothetical protein
MLEVRRWAVERVATEYGVPLASSGLGTGRAENLADAQAQLYADTLLPYCQDFSKMLDQRCWCASTTGPTAPSSSASTRS